MPPKPDVLEIPKWFWALLLMAVAWAFHQSLEVAAIRSTQAQILAEHERRIVHLEDRCDDLVNRMFGVEGKIPDRRIGSHP